MAQGHTYCAPSQDQSWYILKWSLRLAHSALHFQFFYNKNLKKTMRNSSKFILPPKTQHKKKHICNFSSLKFPIIVLPLPEFIFLQHIEAFIFLLINKDKRIYQSKFQTFQSIVYKFNATTWLWKLKIGRFTLKMFKLKWTYLQNLHFCFFVFFASFNEKIWSRSSSFTHDNEIFTFRITKA